VQLVSESKPQVRRDRFLRLSAVEALSGLKKSTIYLLMKRDEFPRSIQISTRCVVWNETAVLQWMQDRISAAAKTSERQTELPS
jgi:prophage regulatory protein